MSFITDLLNIIGNFIHGIIQSIFGFSPFLVDAITMGLAAVILCTFAAVSFMGLTYVERKLVARIQDRVGPNQAGPVGLLQPIADGIKMFTKEDTTPAAADRWVYNLAPLVIAVFAVTAWADLRLGGRVLARANVLPYAALLAGLMLIFNGYLTARPVVLYDPAYQLDWLIGTIPVEDFLYGYSLLLGCTSLFEKFRSRHD